MTKIITVSEYSEVNIPDYHLTQEERTYLTNLSTKETRDRRENRFFIDELRSGLRIKTLSWVGVIELSDIRIEIYPKFNHGFHSLIDMICFVEQISFYQWHNTTAQLEKNNFMELFLRLFLTELDKLFQIGIVREYIHEEDNLRQLRGRVGLIKNLRLNHSTPTRIYCCYDELVTNIAENQVIRTALEIGNRYKVHPSTKRKLNRFRSEFEMFCDIHSCEPWPDFYYHRLNSHYKMTHRLAKYIVQQVSVQNMYHKQNESFFSLLIDMNDIFERFVVTLLEKYLPKNFKVEPGKRITDAILNEGDRYRDIIPDIIVKDTVNKKAIVLDSKYKNYGSSKIGNEDIYQLHFYSQYFHQSDDSFCKSAIIYPKYEGESDTTSIIDLLPNGIHKGKLKACSVSIEMLLSFVKENNYSLLSEKALGLIYF